MKRLITIFIFLFSIYLYSQEIPYLSSRDHAILISAQVDKEDMTVKLSWEKNPLADGYILLKRENRMGDFVELRPDLFLDTSVTSYSENLESPGVLYEYMILAASVGSIITKVDNKDTTVAIPFYGIGYIATGIDVEINNPKGRVLLITERELFAQIPEEILRLREDLHNEGYGVTFKEFGRTETFNKDSVKAVKNFIINEYNNSSDISSIILLGRIPVPYSGSIAPDGHGDHVGAWPADLYYGQVSGGYWNDFSVNNTTAKREENRNVPNDGKFDISQLPNGMDVSIAVGRIDFYNMPAFITEDTDETTLYKNYLDKNHNYRTGITQTVFRGVVDDNFAARRYTEGFASGGWRNMAAITGKDNVKAGDFISSLKTDPYLMAYGTGGGSYTSAGGIGSTSDMAANQLNGVFTMLFGSYFGDWDVQNSFLRSPLATMPNVLTSCWSGRPQWYMHHMAMGYPIGYSTKLSQNNLQEYYPNLYQNGSQLQLMTFGNRQVHIALLGDPTLTAYPASELQSPQNVTALPESKSIYAIEWEAPDTDDILFYNIYRSNDEYGSYLKLNDKPIESTSYKDEEVFLDGTIYYMVRSVKPRETNTGIFMQESMGAFASVLTDVPVKVSDNSVVAGPIPASDKLNISITVDNNSRVEAEIYDMNGNSVYSIVDDYLPAGKYNMIWNIRGDLPSGIYILRTYIGNSHYTNKIIINR